MWLSFSFSSTPIVNSDHSTDEVKLPVTPPPISGYAGVVGGNNNHNPTTPTSLTQNDVTPKNTTPNSKRPPSIVVPHNSNSEQTETGWLRAVKSKLDWNGNLAVMFEAKLTFNH